MHVIQYMTFLYARTLVHECDIDCMMFILGFLPIRACPIRRIESTIRIYTTALHSHLKNKQHGIPINDFGFSPSFQPAIFHIDFI